MNPRYLLDTSIVSLALRGRAPGVPRRLSTQRGLIAISVVTAMELCYGLAKKPSTKSRAAVERFLSAMPVAALPDDIPNVYGSIRAALDADPIGPMDTIIAAHAVAAGCTLVTDNEREFRRVPNLRVENWT